MMRIRWDKLEGVATLHRGRLTFRSSTSLPNATEEDSLWFSDVSQAMVSKRVATSVRLVLTSGRTVDLQFASTADRDATISAVAESARGAAEGASVQPVKTEQPVHGSNIGVPAEASKAAAASQTRLPFVQVKKEVDALLSEPTVRGAVHVLSALNSIIDPTTLQLRPVTEQMECDILRQMPELAAVYAAKVLTPDDRRVFWEAVVKRYFCSSRSFLDDELVTTPTPIPAASPTTGAGAHVVFGDRGAGQGESTLSLDLNRAAEVALPPLRTTFGGGDANEEEDDAVFGVSRGQDAEYASRCGRRLFITPLRFETLPVSAASSAATASSISTASKNSRAAPPYETRNAVRLPDSVIAFHVPDSERHDKAARLLRAFWQADGESSQSKARVALEALLPTLAPESVMANCVRAALSA